MNPNDLIMISVDDHLVEPPTMFDQHLPAKYKSQAPKVVRRDDGSDVWTFNGSIIVLWDRGSGTSVAQPTVTAEIPTGTSSPTPVGQTPAPTGPSTPPATPWR